VNAEGLDLGDYSDVITITSNDPENSVIEVPVSMSVIFEDITPPTVNINTPSNASIGNETLITWQAEDNSGFRSHHLYFSSVTGQEYTFVDSVDGSIATYLWTVPNVVSETARFSILSYDLVGLTDTDTTDVFTIIDEIPPEVTVLTPIAETSIPEYEEIMVTWEAIDNIEMSDSVRIYYSNNGGDSFTEMDSTSFSIPAGVTDSAQVKLIAKDIYGNEGEGFSDLFSVTDNTPPTIELLSPAVGAELELGSIEQITWSATDNDSISHVNLEYNVDGAGWTLISENEEDDGEYDWIVSDDPSTDVALRIIAVDRVGLTDTSTVDGLSIIIVYPVVASLFFLNLVLLGGQKIN